MRLRDSSPLCPSSFPLAPHRSTLSAKVRGSRFNHHECSVRGPLRTSAHRRPPHRRPRPALGLHAVQCCHQWARACRSGPGDGKLRKKNFLRRRKSCGWLRRVPASFFHLVGLCRRGVGGREGSKRSWPRRPNRRLGAWSTMWAAGRGRLGALAGGGDPGWRLRRSHGRLCRR